MDLISQLLRMISCTFYRDMLFTKHKYIIGNTCSHIFTDREGFIYVHSMRYKSQTGEYLNVVTKDIVVPNNLISDNAGKHMGSQT